MINYCRKCDGFKTIPAPTRHWWQFWKFVPCDACGGDGIAKPPGWPDEAEIARLRPKPPAPPPKPMPPQIIVIRETQIPNASR